MKKAGRLVGLRADKRFQLHPRQPRANKLDGPQRSLCKMDPLFREALRQRVANPDRFSAFEAGAASYIDFDRPCPKCESFRRRVRDRSCYACHLRRSGENFERIKAGLAPQVQHSKAGYLDLLERQKAEQKGDCVTQTFGGLTVTRWPTGRLEVLFPDGHLEPDLSKQDGKYVHRLMDALPDLKDALIWAGWF